MQIPFSPLRTRRIRRHGSQLHRARSKARLRSRKLHRRWNSLVHQLRRLSGDRRLPLRSSAKHQPISSNITQMGERSTCDRDQTWLDAARTCRNLAPAWLYSLLTVLLKLLVTCIPRTARSKAVRGHPTAHGVAHGQAQIPHHPSPSHDVCQADMLVYLGLRNL